MKLKGREQYAVYTRTLLTFTYIYQHLIRKIRKKDGTSWNFTSLELYFSIATWGEKITNLWNHREAGNRTPIHFHDSTWKGKSGEVRTIHMLKCKVGDMLRWISNNIYWKILWILQNSVNMDVFMTSYFDSYFRERNAACQAVWPIAYDLHYSWNTCIYRKNCAYDFK